MSYQHDYDEIRHAEQIANDTLVVNWRFHSICNYSCSYCPPSLHDGARLGLDLDVVFKGVDKILAQTKKKNVFFEFTGGEMTYYRKFRELFEGLKARKVATGIISNGSRDLDWWSAHRHLLDHVCLSFHCEEGHFDHFRKVAELLNQSCKVHINIMMKPDRFNELHNFAYILSSAMPGISLSMQPLQEDMKYQLFNYTSEQLKIMQEQDLPKFTRHENFKDNIFRGALLKHTNSTNQDIATHTTELISRGENNWLGWTCWAGIENIVVDEDGLLYRGWCRQGGDFGSILTDFKIPDRPVLCLANSCSCGLDIMCTKKKNYVG